ncbi:MAG TPA: RidA family protein [Roseovarius sp.]
MSDKIVKISGNTENAPTSPVSSQTVAFSHYNHISAQLPIDPKTDNLIAGGIKEQTEQCFANIRAIIESTDHVLDDVIKITIFLKDIADLEAVDAVHATMFHGYLPTRTTYAVASLPMEGALVQIDAVISNGEGTPPQEPCDLFKVAENTRNAPIRSTSTQSVAFSHYNTLSAQLPVDPESGEIVAGDVAEQTGQCLKNIKAVLESIDVPFDDIVKINIYLRDLSDIDAVDNIYKTFFPDSAIARAVAYVPARTIIAASDLPLGASVQIDAVVSHGDGTPPQEIEDRHGIVIRARNTENAPIKSLSMQTVAFSHYNNISAQLPIDPRSGEIISGDVQEQARRCMENIKNILQSVGHVMDDIVKVNVYLTDMADIDAVNDAYTPFFNGDLPARTAVGVSSILMDAMVQIDAVVSNSEGTPPV